MSSQQPDLFQSILKLLQLIGWPIVIGLAWKIAHWLGRVETKAETAFAKITGNDLEHIQGSLTQIETHQEAMLIEMRELRQDLRSKK